MAKKKIAHVLHSVGGVDVSLRLILENINQDKFYSIVIHGQNDTKNDFSNAKSGNVKEYKFSIFRDIKPFKDLIAIVKTIKTLKREKPDLIHAHSAKGGIIGKIAGYFLKIPVLHTPQAYSYLSAENKSKRNLYLKIEAFFKRLNNKILASSNSEKNRAIKEVGYKPENVLLFNNSINPISNIEPLSITKTWPEQYICSVGRPSYQKNIELMLDVLNEVKKTVPGVHLVLMGVGFHSPNLESVKQKIQQLNLVKNITLLEWTKREDIFNIIKNAQLYLTTARYEGLPYSVIESLALSKPIVATDADGNRDLVEQEQNGFLVYNENIEQLSKHVIDLIVDKELNKKLSKKSKKLFDDKFNMNTNIRLLEEVYLENIKCE